MTMLKEILLDMLCWAFHWRHRECLGKKWCDVYEYRCNKCGRHWERETI